jgi:glycosyltransferase involved in cell wall biosynthesis
MKILIFSWRGPRHPQAGGAEIVVHEHAKAWVKAGHKVTLFTSSFNNAIDEGLIDGVKIIRQGNQSLQVHINAFIWYLFKRKEKFDLIIDNFHGIPFFTPLYTKTKKLAFIHEVAREVWAMNPWPKPFNLIPTLVGGIAEPFIFKFFYKKVPFLTVSNSTKTELKEIGIPEKNITVINNGVVIEKVKNIKKEKVKTVIFLGALTKDKGIENALEVFKMIFREENNCNFWVVGKGEKEYTKKLINYANKNGLKNKIRFWGFVDNKKKFELLKRAHVLLNTSVREGWGLVVIEAAAMGTPTIAFDVPGLRDSIINDKTGIIIANNSPTSMAKSVIDLLNNKMQYKKLSKNAIDRSKEFSWNKSTSNSLKLIENL